MAAVYVGSWNVRNYKKFLLIWMIMQLNYHNDIRK